MTKQELINRVQTTFGISTMGIKVVDNDNGSVDVYVHGVYICTRQIEEECRICGTMGVLQYGLCSSCVSPVIEEEKAK